MTRHARALMSIDDEEALYGVLWRVLHADGFGAVMRLCAKTQRRLAADYPRTVASEGWIA